LIYLYPANKTENLLALVNKIQHISPLSIFEKEVIIVQNAGMQHWLNMSLAQSRGICLNIDYALPAQFFWKLLRTILNNGDDIDQKPFSREAMCWRIFELLASSEVVFDDDFAEVTQYWSNKNTNVSGLSSSSTYSTQENLKRYQLSCQLADLFEQYLVFRPNWVNIWYKKQVISDINLNESFANKEKWQAKLWQMLTSEQEYNPLKFIELAAKKLPEVSHLLPKRLSCFGLNAMAPMWLSFIHEMSKVTEVHFFHLNPCFDYWGDIVTEKQSVLFNSINCI